MTHNGLTELRLSVPEAGKPLLRQMDPAVEVWVHEARRRNPDWGPRRLVHEASRAGIEPAPSRSGIYRALKRAELIDPQARRRRDRKFRLWERGGPMELWQVDVVGGGSPYRERALHRL